MDRCALRRFAFGVMIVFFVAGCLPSESTPPDVSEPVTQRSESVLLIGGHAPTLPLMAHLAESFSAAHPGLPLEIAPALTGDGSLRALRDGRLDLAVTLESHTVAGARTLAMSKMVLALGRGIDARTFTVEDLTQFWRARSSANGHQGIHFVYGTRNDPYLSILAQYVPDIARDIIRPLPGGRSSAGARPGGLARVAGDRRGGAALALDGNLRMLGIPVWVGALPSSISSVHVVAHYGDLHPRLNAFFTYLDSPEGHRVIANFGFEPVAQR